MEKVLRLLRRKERWLVVAGVRFLRTCIGTKDDFYMRHLIRNNLLDPVMAVFFENGERYNLLNSAVLELVEFIRKENIKVSGTQSALLWRQWQPLLRCHWCHSCFLMESMALRASIAYQKWAIPVPVHIAASASRVAALGLCSYPAACTSPGAG